MNVIGSLTCARCHIEYRYKTIDNTKDHTGWICDDCELAATNVNLKTKYKYIEFLKDDCTLNRWNIWNHKYNDFLGHLEFNRKWKQWEFVPEYCTGFTKSCLVDIINFINQLTAIKSDIK